MKKMSELAAPLFVLMAIMIVGFRFLPTAAAQNANHVIRVIDVRVGPRTSETEANQARREFLGKTKAEVIAKLGEPTDAAPLRDTGGAMYMYAMPGHRGYLFELDRGDSRSATAKAER